MADEQQELPPWARVCDVHPLEIKAGEPMVFVVPVAASARLVAIAPVVERSMISASGAPTGRMKPHLVFDAPAQGARIPRRFVLVPAGGYIGEKTATCVGHFFLFDPRQMNPSVGLPVLVYEVPFTEEEIAEIMAPKVDVYATISKVRDAEDAAKTVAGVRDELDPDDMAGDDGNGDRDVGGEAD